MKASRFCTQCGGQAVDDERFCTQCGHDIRAGSLGVEAHNGAVAETSGGTGAPAAVLPERATAFSTQSAEPAASSMAPPFPDARRATPTRSGRRPWLAIAFSGLIILTMVAAAAVVLITASGKPSPRVRSLTAQRVQLTNALLASRQLYAATQQPSYSALLPAGWQQVATRVPSLTAATTVQSPVDDRATITVGQIAKPAPTLRAEAKNLLRLHASTVGFHRDVNASTKLAGGRPAWVFAYDAGGLSAAYYLVRSCGRTFAVSAAVPPARASVLRARVAIVAGTLQGNC
jgi:hypothetical protein